MDIGGAIKILFENGGVATYFIFASAFFLAFFGIERVFSLFFLLSYNAEGAMETIRSNILDRRYTQAIQVCNSKPRSQELAVVKAGLLAVENGREAMKSAIGAEVLAVSHRCEIRIQYLALIANMGTLLGLMGTILGLIKTFGAIANADAAQKARMLGIGISEAMYATAAGLIVGVSAMVIHTICSQKADTVIGQSQDAGLRLITWVEQSERASTHGK